MEILLVILNVALILFSLVFAFVVYQLIKSVYAYLKLFNDKLEKPSLLFRLSPRVVSVLFVICFMAMVL